MKFLPLIIILLWAGLMASCGGDRRVDTVLTSVDSLVFTAPDSAVRLLDSLTLDRASSAQLDRHALLTAKAREKAGIIARDDTPDSMLSRSIDALGVAADHFRGRGDSLEVQTLFYRGVLLGYRGDYSEALVSLMEAADRAADTGDNFYRAMSCREQSKIYTDLYAFDQSVCLGQEAVEAFTLAGRPLHAAWKQIYLPQSLAYSGKADEAREMIGKLITDSIIMSDKAIRRRLYDIAVNVCMKCNDPESAEKYFEAYSGEGGMASSKQLSSMVSLKLRQGDTAGALHYYNLALAACQNAADSAAADWALVELYKAQGNYKKALNLQESLDNIIYKETNHLISHPYTALLTDYYHEETKSKQLQLDEAGAEKLILILLSVIILASAVMVTLYYRQRVRRKGAERELLLADIVKLESIIKDEREKNKTAVNSTFAIDLLNDIVESANHMLSVKDGMSRFGKDITAIIMNLGDSRKLAYLETVVNNDNDMVMARFRSSPVGFSDTECYVALFVFLGFSNTSIATILKLRCDNVRQIRYRIRTKLKAHDSDDCKSLLKYF